MGQSFASSPSFMITSESVTEGHPDKICDLVSDSVLDYILAHDPNARVACETCTGDGMLIVFGEVTTTCDFDAAAIAKQTVRDIGYNAATGFDYEKVPIQVNIHAQSPDIDGGVSSSVETRAASAIEANDLATLGAGDQGMMVGFACNETPELMPLPISLAHRLTHQLTNMRRGEILPYLRPDGKSQVTVEYAHGVPKRVHTVIISTQHDEDVNHDQLKRDILEKVIYPVIPEEFLDENTIYHINPSGRFVLGGPAADSGLTGRKILVDTYGGVARHGGGAFSGKDPTKVDRSAAYAARYVAKNIVAAGLAERAEIQVSYAIGVASPISINLETFGTAKVDEDIIVDLVSKRFDLRPGAIIRDLELRHPIYKQTAAYGHFGRPDLDLPWERTDRADLLRADAGIMGSSVSVSDD